MKKWVLISFAFFVSGFSFSQNLVPNFGFEQYSSCPTTGDQVEFCTGWSKYSASSTTPDYYNSCSPSNAMGVPQSYFFYQTDHRNCGAYIGLVTWTNNPNEREHVGIQLTQPLTIGQKYYLSFYTVMGGTNDGSFYYESPSNNIGMRLSTIAYSPPSPASINNFAHLRSVSIINDTLNWVRISGSIIADSTYNYLILGNFYDDANTDTTTLNCANCINNYSYYLVDDVCVSTDSTLCNGGVDALPCQVTVEENIFSNHFYISPNPVNEYILINSSLKTPFNIEVYTALGQLLYTEQNINNNNFQIDVSYYTSGFHFIKITSPKNQFMYKFLKQ